MIENGFYLILEILLSNDDIFIILILIIGIIMILTCIEDLTKEDNDDSN